jgi:hypothetical protein
VSLESSLQLRQRTLPDEFLRYDSFAQVLGDIQEDATSTMPRG